MVCYFGRKRALRKEFPRVAGEKIQAYEARIRIEELQLCIEVEGAPIDRLQWQLQMAIDPLTV